MMYQRSPIQGYYLDHLADIYSRETKIGGDTSVEKALAYGVNCHAYELSDVMVDAMLGAAAQKRWKVILPLYDDNGEDVIVKIGYQLGITLEDKSTLRISVEHIRKYLQSHIEVEGVEIGV